MEPSNFIQYLCLSIPVIIIIGIIVLMVLFFIIRSIIRNARRKAGIPKGAGNLIRNQIKNIDQYLQNDERQTAQWERDSQPLDLAVSFSDGKISDFSYESDPTPPADDSAKVGNCPACGAPTRPNSKTCGFCGSKL